jgi:hypothetical protein
MVGPADDLRQPSGYQDNFFVGPFLQGRFARKGIFFPFKEGEFPVPECF